jgi:hypothetical protein
MVEAFAVIFIAVGAIEAVWMLLKTPREGAGKPFGCALASGFSWASNLSWERISYGRQSLRRGRKSGSLAQLLSSEHF